MHKIFSYLFFQFLVFQLAAQTQTGKLTGAFAAGSSIIFGYTATQSTMVIQIIPQ